MSNERRVLRATLRAETYASNGAKVLRGVAAAYGVPTRLGDWHEVIAKGAFTQALRRGDDVRALINHDPNLILGRTKSGTLRLFESAKGLEFSVILPETTIGRDAWISVSRGDWSDCSFAFSVDGSDGESWIDDWDCSDSEDCCGRNTPLRTLKNVRLYDVAVAVTYPAYKQGTSVKGLVEDLSAHSDDDSDEDDTGSDGSGPWYQNSAVVVSVEARTRARRSHRHTAAKEATDFAARLFKAQVRATRDLSRQ